jgi:hypothetical protein
MNRGRPDGSPVAAELRCTRGSGAVARPEQGRRLELPIIKHGLIYVVDIRNGLYIFQYTGRHAHETSRIGFLEGNSNLGDAGRLAGEADDDDRDHDD